MCYEVYDMLRRVLGVAVAVALAVACASPTLPLPPPETPVISAGPDKDHVRLAGAGVEPKAAVVVENLNPNVPGDEAVSGAFATEYGQWDCTVYAHVGDTLSITQEQGTTRSQSTIVVVHLP